MQTIFSSREIASLIWLSALAAWSLTKPAVRSSLRTLAASALGPHISVPIMALAAYAAGEVWLLHRIGFWTEDLTKDTVVWFVATTATVLWLASTVTSETHSIVQRLLADQVATIVLLEYFLNTYTFSLPIELVLQPALAVLAVQRVIGSQTDSRRMGTLSAFQALIGFVVFGAALHQAWSTHTGFDAAATLRSIALPPLLSILFMPAAYVLLLYTVYDTMFSGLHHGLGADGTFPRKARRLLICHFRFSLRRAAAFVRGRKRELRQARDIESVGALIRLERSGDQ
jgi:hypothetical protein